MTRRAPIKTYPPFAPYLFLFLTLLGAASLQAQEAPDPPTDAEAEVFEVPPEHSSARATMRTFLYAFDPTREQPGEPLARAAACLDLSEIPEALREHQGKELAIQLKDILDRTELIDVETLSDDPQAPPYELEVHEEGTVRLAPDANGEWLFDVQTVREIPQLLAAVRDRATVEGASRIEILTPAMWLRSQMPDSLLDVTFLLENWQWLALLVLVVLGMLLDGLVAFVGRIAAERYLARKFHSVESDRLKRALRPVGLFAAALFWWAGIYWLGLPTGVLKVLRLAAHFVVAASFVWATYRLVDVVAAVLEERAKTTGNKYDDLLVPLVRKTVKIVVIAFGLVFIADTLAMPIRSILAGLGIGGLAVALAAQDAVKNFIGSLIVILDRPFSVGDYVVVGDIDGSVEEIGFRSTRIRTPGDSVVTLPNSNLINSSVDNLEARRLRRWKTTLGLVYDTPVEKIEAFCEGVRELIRQHPQALQEGYQVVFNEFSASSLDVLMLVKFDVTDWGAELEARQSLGLGILRLAEEIGVELAFPTQTVHVRNA